MFEPTRRGSTLVLSLPSHCDDPGLATAKWLLALWQASSRYRTLLWRSQATIALELVAEAGQLRYQTHLHDALLARVSAALLTAHLPGGEAIPTCSQNLVTRMEPAGVIVSFHPRHAGWIDLAPDSRPEGVAGLLGALAEASMNGWAIVQLLLDPAWMRTDDGAQPAFWFAGRIAVGTRDVDRAASGARLVASAFGQYAAFNWFRFERPRRLGARELRALDERRWPRRLLPLGQVLTPRQIAAVYHPPLEAAHVPGLRVVDYVRTPTRVRDHGVPLGEGRDERGHPATLRLDPPDLLRHALVIGPSGAGKTTLLAHLARGLAAAGHGVSVIDPHGGLVRELARTLPATRLHDGLLFRFADTDHPIAINPLHAQRGREFLAADELVEILQRVQGREYWGPLLDLLLRHAALASAELGGSLVEAARLLDDPWYRERALPSLRNAETARALARLGTDERRVMPALHRLQRLLATPSLRNVLGQAGPGLEVGELFDRRAVALFDLSGVGTTNAKLLGSLLLLRIRQAALSRPEGARLHFVIVDEASWFLSSRTVAELLDQARKFGVGLVLAVQRLGQLVPEETREAVLANAATTVAFRIADREEAAFLARHLGSDRVGASDLQHLPRYEAYTQLTIDGDRLEPGWFRATAPVQEPADANERQAVLTATARRRYARPRSEVEAALHAREAAMNSDDEPEIRALARPPLPADAA